MEQKSDRLKKIFLTRGFQRKFHAKEMIFMEKDREECLYYIAEGLVKLFMNSNEGKEKTLVLLSSGQVFGEVSVFDGLDYPVNALALTDTVVYSMNQVEINDLLKEESEIAFDLLRLMAEKMRGGIQQIKDLVFFDIAGRLASQILHFSKQFGEKTERGILINISLTHQEYADLLGASRVTVTKTLNLFQSEGVIDTVNRRILVIDQQKLLNYIAENNAS